MTGPETSPMAEARQADADFGLFSGRATGQQPDATDQPDEPGDQPDDIYDPTFFEV